jgi:excisionase family DNA binding protein
MQRLLTPRELADALNVSDGMVRQHAHEWGGIRVGKHWRFHPTVLHRFGLGASTMPDSCPPSVPPSDATNAHPAVAGGVSGGGKVAGSAKSAATTLPTRPRTGRTRSGSAFARDFPEFANR